jgi:hypothetical protein
MTNRLAKSLGSPLCPPPARLSEAEILGLYQEAFENRVALLLLSRHWSNDWNDELKQRFEALEYRRTMTQSVIAEVSRELNAVAAGKFAIFKSLKPFPATPNDTDVIFFGDANEYEAAFSHSVPRMGPATAHSRGSKRRDTRRQG